MTIEMLRKVKELNDLGSKAMITTPQLLAYMFWRGGAEPFSGLCYPDEIDNIPGVIRSIPLYDIDPCVTNSVLSCVCNRGTKCCNKVHAI